MNISLSFDLPKFQKCHQILSPARYNLTFFMAFPYKTKHDALKMKKEKKIAIDLHHGAIHK